jgi:localization factor PodJL
VPAEYRLGALYEKGIGVDKSASKAREWYERAADHGNIRAMHNLGVLYADGALGKPDFAMAARWFRKAADYGLKDSQSNLGVLYARGLAVKQNLPEAYLWFSLAADQGDKDAADKRDQIAKKMNAKQLDTARVAAGTWQAKKPIVAANEVPIPAGGEDGSPTTARATGKHTGGAE